MLSTVYGRPCFSNSTQFLIVKAAPKGMQHDVDSTALGLQTNECYLFKKQWRRLGGEVKPENLQRLVIGL